MEDAQYIEKVRRYEEASDMIEKVTEMVADDPEMWKRAVLLRVSIFSELVKYKNLTDLQRHTAMEFLDELEVGAHFSAHGGKDLPIWKPRKAS